MDIFSDHVCVDFPLRGEWLAATTPADKIPSHGTDLFGQRYAYDFAMVKRSEKNIKPFRGNVLFYYLFGMSLERWYGWGQNVYAPCNGEIVVARDGIKERRPHLISDLFTALKNSVFISKKKDFCQLAGNHIIIRAKEGYACLAHLQEGSVCVNEGQQIKTGEIIGRVGHSGNSTGPHLHFQMMDRPDFLITAKGIPCAFNQYEKKLVTAWEEIKEGIPSSKDRIRKQ